MSDPIDDLLDRAAPTIADRGSARDVALAQMVADARDTVRPPRAARRRTALTAALVGAFVIGGGGVAVAAGFVSWPDRYQSAENVVAFELGSGRQCESRFVVAESETAEPLRTPETSEVHRWLENVDLMAAIDMDAARARDEENAQASPDQTVIIGPEGWLMDVPQAPATRSVDDIEATLLDSALKDVIYQRMVETDVPINDWTILGGVKCEA